MKRRFLYSEQKLSELIGISRTDIKKLRLEMKKGVEWRKSKKGKGGSIELSEGAVQIVLKTFGLTETDPAPARIDFGKTAKRTIGPKQETLTVPQSVHDGMADIAAGRTVSFDVALTQPYPQSSTISGAASSVTVEVLKLLKVTSLPPNKRIVKAVNGTGEIYDVIVRDSIVWAIGDPLRAKQSKHHGYLELVGNAPRWRGDRIYTHTFE